MAALVVVRSFAGAELCSAHLAPSTKAVDLKDKIARDLRLFPFAFELLCPDGNCFCGSVEQHLVEHELRLTLIKRDVPTASLSSRMMRLQSSVPEAVAGAGPTFVGSVHDNHLRELLAVVVLVVGLLHWFGVEQAASMEDRMCVIYVIYLLEALKLNSIARALRHLGSIESAKAYIAGVKQAGPLLRIKAACYHFTTQTRINKAGREIQTHTKVQDATFTDNLRIQCWIDDSEDLAEGLDLVPLLLIRFRMECTTADDATADAHDQQRLDLRARAFQHGDLHDFVEELSLEDGSALPYSDMLCTTGDAGWWLRWKVYVLASCLGLSWPYRWCLARTCMKGDFVFTKRVWA